MLGHSQNIFQERHAVGKVASMYCSTPNSHVFSTVFSIKKGSVRTVWPARVSRARKEQVPTEIHKMWCSHNNVRLWQAHRVLGLFST